MKFIADDMCGRLAKWLRILGYDTLYHRQISDSRLIRLSHKERRVILTRDTHLEDKMRSRKFVLLKSDKYPEQLRQVVTELKLRPNPKRFFTRCLECNKPIKRIRKRKVEGKVPAYVYNTKRVFKKCPKCRKIYWSGTHQENSIKKLNRILKKRSKK